MSITIEAYFSANAVGASSADMNIIAARASVLNAGVKARCFIVAYLRKSINPEPPEVYDRVA